MIEWVNRRMKDWADWSKRCKDGGIGYPGAANFCAMHTNVAHSSGPIVIDASAMEIERIMIDFRQNKPHRYDVAFWVYLAGNLTMDRVAKELHCGRDTVYARLHALHLDVSNSIDDKHKLKKSAR